MSIYCDVLVRAGATSEELKVLGKALWRWYSRSSGDAVLCQTVGSQALADLLAGRLPSTRRSPLNDGQPFVHFRLRAGAYPDRAATFASLREEIPEGQVSNVLVDGMSWTSPPAPLEPGGKGSSPSIN